VSGVVFLASRRFCLSVSCVCFVSVTYQRCERATTATADHCACAPSPRRRWTWPIPLSGGLTTSPTFNHGSSGHYSATGQHVQGPLIVTQAWKQTSGNPSGLKWNHHLMANNVNLLGHLLWDDLINPVKMSVRPYVRPSVRTYVRPQSNSMQP